MNVTPVPTPVPLSDPRVSDWPLMYSPVVPLATVGVYLTAVVLGPRLMKHRSPLSLHAPIVVYNLSLVLMSAYMCYEVWNETCRLPEGEVFK